MQTLTTTLFPCYAARDRKTAAALAAFVERGANVRVFLEEGELRPGEDLVAKARDGRMADMVLVLFSQHSLPARWARALWEAALIHEPAEEGVRMGFATCDDCLPPRVLTPRFDLRDLRPGGLRQVKRWVRGMAADYAAPPGPEADALGAAIADRPGAESAATAESAAGFLDAFRADFDEVFVLECADRSLAALAGDLGARLGLRLEGDVESNLERLREFCRSRRFLVVLADAPAAQAPRLTFGGQCSTLLAPGPLPRLQPEGIDAVREIQRAMASWERAPSWQELCAHARLGRRLTQELGRIAECYELMKQWYAAAEEQGDLAVLDECARAMVWILEGWGRVVEAQRLEYLRASEFGEQTMLPF